MLGLHTYRGPQAPLLAPVGHQSDTLKLAQTNRIPALTEARQEQNCFLDDRSEQPQIHDLSDASPRYMRESGQLGVVRYIASLDQVFEPNRQCHQPGHTRDSAALQCGFILGVRLTN